MACQLGNATRTVLHRQELGYAVVFTGIERSTWIRNFPACDSTVSMRLPSKIVSEWLVELDITPKGTFATVYATTIREDWSSSELFTSVSVNRLTFRNLTISGFGVRFRRRFEINGATCIMGLKGRLTKKQRRMNKRWYEGIGNYRMEPFRSTFSFGALE